MRLRTGIVGYGAVGRRRRALLAEHPDFEVTCVCDRVFPDGEAEDVRRFDDVEALLREPLDVLFVALPTHLAADATIAGLERGLHVFCEKPPARTPGELMQVIRCEHERPAQRLMYGFNHRYHGAVRAALTLVRSGELGQVLDLRGAYGKSFVQRDGGWRGQRALAGGGILLDQGIHMLDLFRLFAGEFDEVRAFVADRYWRHDVEDNAYALLRARGGVVAMLHSSATQWRHLFRLEISLEAGALVLDGILSSSGTYGPESLRVVRRGGPGVVHEEVLQFRDDPSWREEIEAFAAAIRSGRPPPWGGSEDARRTLELVHQVYEAGSPRVSPPPARAEAFAAAYLARSAAVIAGVSPESIAGMLAVLAAARRRGSTVFVLGNGGSAATAAHFVNDLCFGARPPLRAICLSDNTPGLTALANDHSYREAFARALKVHLRDGDVVVALSASGNSENVLAAVAYANERGAPTVGLTGFDGGRLRSMARHAVHVPSTAGEYGPVEDAHLAIAHLATAYLNQSSDPSEGATCGSSA